MAVDALHVDGKGVPQDATEAARLLGQAAAQGCASAQSFLGNLHLKGTGVPSQDPVEAARLWRLSAAKGNSNAQRDLGLLGIDGDGVEQDFADAAKLLKRAAAHDDAFALKA
jgi:hypothetical protein